ncbi:MAG TPA: hypothetical protein VEX39_07940 [Thermoleophilaceae bacterium]|nr:hypothetical protein [Thermoleophilaceae bacterium]
MIDDESSDEGTKDTDDEAEAAEHDAGQDQEPKQAGETDSIFDTEQHSDAPGPFGTGQPWDAEDKKDEDAEE